MSHPAFRGVTRPHLGELTHWQFYEVWSSTIGRAIRKIRPLLAERVFAVPDRPGLRLRTLEDVFAYATAENVTLRIDGTETQAPLAAPAAEGEGGAASSGFLRRVMATPTSTIIIPAAARGLKGSSSTTNPRTSDTTGSR